MKNEHNRPINNISKKLLHLKAPMSSLVKAEDQNPKYGHVELTKQKKKTNVLLPCLLSAMNLLPLKHPGLAEHQKLKIEHTALSEHKSEHMFIYPVRRPIEIKILLDSIPGSF